MPAIEITDLYKAYGATRAVDGLSFSVERGEIFGLLGPNGAGKTTTVEIAEGLRRPDSGRVSVLGFDVLREPQAVKRRIGVQLQTTALYPRLNVREVLQLFSSFYASGQRPVDELIDLFNLRDKQRTLSKDLSGGQKQRLSVALALINRPELVFLDEPTTGLDPQARRSLWETIRTIRAEGATLLLTTHSMEEAELLCDRVAVVDAGKIIALDTPTRLIEAHFAESALEFTLRGALPPEGVFRELPGVTRPAVREGQAQHVTLSTGDTTATLAGLIALSQSGQLQFDDLHIRRATLEDVFLKLTGRRIRE
jgi:ABC-2 type transport system ATP-binding protein